MQEELAELMAGMQAAKLVSEVHTKWRAKAVEFIANQELYKKPHLIEQVLTICEESANVEISNLADNMQKLQALMELEQVKEQSKNKTEEVGVH
jgi:hypothetical protein